MTAVKSQLAPSTDGGAPVLYYQDPATGVFYPTTLAVDTAGVPVGTLTNPWRVTAAAIDSTTEPTSSPLTSNGAAGGPSSLKVNGSGTPVPFYREVPAAHVAYASMITIAVGDGGSWQAGDLGSHTALTNGFSIDVLNANGSTKYVIASGMTSNLTMAQASSYFVTPTQAVALGQFRFDFGILFGGPLLLTAGQRIRVVVNDNASTWGGTSLSAALAWRTVDV